MEYMRNLLMQVLFIFRYATSNCSPDNVDTQALRYINSSSSIR